ncbi:hypothetical protein ATG_18940 [Desulfurococcaceae archaeon AG1]|jgi:TRAP-type C4-dicarboxylate transport system permease small subunit|nr:hypothetical protein ATG_18940 [Desulfurococcaceae archaeon AG1]
MGSTLGGFLVGFGLCLFIVSLAALYGLYMAYTGSIQWADDINRIYNLSHSEPYQRALSVMKNISSIIGPLASFLKAAGINQNVTLYISEIPKGVSYMEEIRVASEKAKNWISMIPLAMIVSALLAIIAIVMIISGYRLVKRQG